MGKFFNVATVVITTGEGVYDNMQKGTDTKRTVTDAAVDASFSAGSVATGAAIGAIVGSVVPVAGTAVGTFVGGVVVVASSVLTPLLFDEFTEKPKERVKEWIDDTTDSIISSNK